MGKLRAVLGVVFVFLAWVACSSSENTSSGQQASAKIGAAGGTVRLPDGAGVEIPAGALSAETEITVARTADGATPTNASAVSAFYKFGPPGTTFAKPVTITLPFETTKLPAGTTIANVIIFSAPDGTSNYEALSTQPKGTSQVAGTTTHFSVHVAGTGGSACVLTCSTGKDTCNCAASCNGRNYRVECTNGASSCTCTTDGNATGTVPPGQSTAAPHAADCTNQKEPFYAYRQGCKYPGDLAQPTPPVQDGGTDASTDCKITVQSADLPDGGGSTDVSTTCNGKKYSLHCEGPPPFPCTTDGTQTGTANGCTTAAFKNECGYPGTP